MELIYVALGAGLAALVAFANKLLKEKELRASLKNPQVVIKPTPLLETPVKAPAKKSAPIAKAPAKKTATSKAAAKKAAKKAPAKKSK